jgi:CspA family cold shock protein
MVAHLDRGTVKMFNTDRGFGFIIPDDGGKDLFVHANTLKMSGIATLAPGDRVEYEKVSDNRGFQAHRVQLV